MKRSAVLAGVLALSLLAAAPLAFADDGRIGGEPGNVRVVGSSDIRMEAETVQAVVYQGFAEYIVDFRFVNDGPEQQVRLGFPFGLDDKTNDRPPVALAGFLASQDGRPLDITITQGMDGPRQTGWFEHSAVFSRGETMIRVRYVTRPSVSAGLPEGVPENAPYGYRGMGGDTAWYTYTLHTGAGWADTIGRGVVRYSLSEDVTGWGFGEAGHEEWGTAPRGFTRPDDRTLQWVFEDFEPTQDPDTGESPYDVRVLFYQPWYLWADYDPERAPDPSWVTPPVTDVTASSENVREGEDPDVRVFPAWQAADGDPATAWATAPGKRRGAWLQLTLGEPRETWELRIVPGDAKTPAAYREHGRPKTIAVTGSDGTTTRLALADEPTVQRFALPGHEASTVTISVESVYPGTRYDDVAVSEVEVASVKAPDFLSFEEALASEGRPVTVGDLAPIEPEPAQESADDEAATADGPADDTPRTPGAGFWIALAAAVIGGGAAGVPSARARARRHRGTMA